MTEGYKDLQRVIKTGKGRQTLKEIVKMLQTLMKSDKGLQGKTQEYYDCQMSKG